MTSHARSASVRSWCSGFVFYSTALVIKIVALVIPNFRSWLEDQCLYWSLNPTDRMLSRVRISSHELRRRQ